MRPSCEGLALASVAAGPGAARRDGSIITAGEQNEGADAAVQDRVDCAPACVGASVSVRVLLDCGEATANGCIDQLGP